MGEEIMASIRHSRMNSIVLSITVVAVTILAASSAQAASVKEIFEKYKLLGTFSYDCTKPADKKNFYYVNRLLDADHVQRDEMSGPSTRDRVIFVNKAEELKPNEVKVSGSDDHGVTSLTAIWHIVPNGVLQWESTHDGKPIIRNGEFLSTQFKMPALNRCGD
jgi:hypothetical protein